MALIPSSGGGEVVDDLTPQLGGDLDVNGKKIVSVSNGNIDIEPHGTGNVLLGNFSLNADQTVGAGQDNYVMTYDHGTGLINLEAAASSGIANVVEDTTPQLGGDLDLNGNQITSPDGTDLIDIPNGSIDLQTNSVSRMDILDTGVRLGATGARVTSITNSDDLGTSDTLLCTQGNVKMYARPKRIIQTSASIYYAALGDWTDSGFGTVTMTQYRVYACPFIPDFDTNTTFNRIGCEITTFQANADVRLGIYDSDGYYPTTLLLDAGTADATSNAIKTITISQSLERKLYFLVAQIDVASVAARAGAARWLSSYGYVSLSSTTANQYYSYYDDRADHTLPATFTVDGSMNAANNQPIIFLQKV